MNNTIRLKAFVLSILILSIVFILFNLYFEHELKWIKKVHLSTLHSNIDTGDIILFRYVTTDLVFRFVSKFTHVGMIIKKNGILYIIECHPNTLCECKNNSGTHIYPLVQKLKTYDGTLYLCKMDLTDTQRKRIKNTVIKNQKNYKQISFEFDTMILLISAIIHQKYPVNKKNMYCSQLVMKIFSDSLVYKNITSLPIIPDIFVYKKLRNTSILQIVN